MSKAMLKLGRHSINADWQQGKDGYVYKNFKMGRQKWGELRKYPDGTMVYWALRKANEAVYRENAWAIDMTTFSILGMQGKPKIGILVDNGDTWITDYDTFDKNKIKWDFSRHIGTLHSSKGKFGAMQWILKYEFWQFTKGTPEDMAKAIHVGKWK